MPPPIQFLQRLVKATLLLCCVLPFAPNRAAYGADTPAPETVATPAGVPVLHVGEPVQGGATLTHPAIYRMELPAARQVTIVLKKHGMPVTATVFTPANERVPGAGPTFAKGGEEQITFRTGSAGTYRLEVRTFFKKKEPVPFEVQLLEVRGETAQERALVGRESTETACRQRNWVDGQDNLLVNVMLNAIADCLSAVAARVAQQHSDAPQVAAFTGAQVGFLTSRWHWGEPISAAYRESLTLDFDALARAAREADDAGAYAVMREVADDVKIKAEHCSRSLRGLGSDVTVKVTTKKGQKEDRGWVVYYTLRIYEFTRGRPPQRFPKLSSPTETALPPAKYLIWAGRPEQAEGAQTQKQLVEVGEGRSRIDWDIFAPQQ